jgi:hypothetical protein
MTTYFLMSVLLDGSAYAQGIEPRIRNDYKGRGMGCQGIPPGSRPRDFPLPRWIDFEGKNP